MGIASEIGDAVLLLLGGLVKASATTKSEKGGRSRRWFKTAKVMASITYGTTILKI